MADDSFRAKDTTVISSVISKAAGGSVELERVTMVRAKDLSAMDITYDVELKKVVDSNGGSAQGSAGTVGLVYQGNFSPASTATYGNLQALAAQIAADGSSAEVKFELTNGTIVDAPPSGDPNEFGFITAVEAWAKYEEQVKTNSVIKEEIFQLDFNKFLKVKGSFRPLYQKLSTS